MRVRGIGTIFAAVSAITLLPLGAVWAQPQTNNQQKCINKLNKDGIKVQAAQGKENTECVKRKANAELGASQSGTAAEACLTTDAKGKVDKKMMKASADELKFCPSAVPDFGYTSAVNVNDAAQQAELNLVHDLFGGPPVDNGLFSKDPNVFEAVCQRNVINRVEKLIQTMGREFVKCKKNALKTDKDPFPSGASSSADLEDCVDNPGAPNSVAADTKGKIAKRKQNLLDTITGQCDPTPFTGDPFGGACNGQAFVSAATLQSCLIDLAECRFCKMINDMDNLAVDCGVFAGTTAAACL
jgi:hypothetical protein